MSISDRSLRAKIAAHERWAREPDRSAATAPARQANTDRYLAAARVLHPFRDGLASAAAGDIPELDALVPDDDQDAPVHPALIAWDKVVDAAVREVAPEAARLLQAAIERRLPWTYDGD